MALGSLTHLAVYREKIGVKTKAFVRNVIGEFEVSEKGTHIGIIVYSSKALLHMKFNEFKGAYLNQVNYQKKADEMPHLKGLTFIDRALKMANTQLFTKANGMREKVKKVKRSLWSSPQDPLYSLDKY